MNRLNIERRAQIIGCLVEGNSIRGTVRMTGAAKNTVTKLLVDIGAACEEYQDGAMHDLACDNLQIDEIWAFCQKKEKNVPEHEKGLFGVGDVYTYTAIDADTKLVPTWLVGQRTAEDAEAFLADLASRLRDRVQITTDGFRPYPKAVSRAFHNNVDFAQLVKMYGPEPFVEKRYSPAVCIGADKRPKIGNPDRDKISTSYVERQNLTMRMGMRRFTRLTNAFSKRIDNLAAAVALHFMHYNFVRVHSTIGTTPAIAAGVADHRWTLNELVQLLEVNSNSN